jgi:hypothetical protein
MSSEENRDSAIPPSRTDALNDLLTFWGVSEFVFLGKFFITEAERLNDSENSFGFFTQLYLNKTRLVWPDGNEGTKHHYATCFAKKARLKNNQFYMIKAELSPDEKRSKSPYALTLIQAVEATEREILEHHSVFGSSNLSDLACVIHVAKDNSHAYVKVIDDLNPKNVQRLVKYKNGEILDGFRGSLQRGQIVRVYRDSSKKSVSFFSDLLSGTLCRENVFVNLELFFAPLIWEISNKTVFKGVASENGNSREDCVVRIYVSDAGFKIDRVETTEKSVQNNIDEFVTRELNDLFQNEIAKEEFKGRIKVLESIDSGLNNKIAEIIQREWNQAKEENVEKKLRDFLLYWMNKFPEFVNFSNLKDADYIVLFFNMWKEDQLPLDFFESNLIEFLIKYFELPGTNRKFFIGTLHPSHIEFLKLHYLNFLRTSFSIDSIEVFSIMESIIIDLKFYLPERESAISTLINRSSDNVLFSLWLENRREVFPKNIAIEKFKHLDAKQQQRVCRELNDIELIPFITDVKLGVNEELVVRIENLKEKILFERFGFVLFDIEIRNDTITEIAWTDSINDNEFIDKNFMGKDVPEGIIRFKELEKSKILIGHNIVDFDLPFLSKNYNLVFDEYLIWDTFNVEKVLSPELKTYALNGSHHAKEDVQLNLHLFKSQFLRILKVIEDCPEIVSGMLPEGIIDRVYSVSREFQFSSSLTALDKEKVKYFRIQPRTNPLIKKLQILLDDSTSQDKVVLVDDSIVAEVLNFGKLRFASGFENKLDFQIVSRLNVENSGELGQLQRKQILSYLTYCKKMSLLPYWGNVSPSVRIDIEQTISDTWSLFERSDNQELIAEYPLVVAASNIELLSSDLIRPAVTEIFVVNPDLISVSQKLLLKDVDAEQLKALFQESHFWMKFSGGQSSVAISKIEAELILGLELISNGFFWIEKYHYGKYKIFANTDWEKYVSGLYFKKVTYLESESADFNSDQMSSVSIKTNIGNEYGTSRLNPETIYRSRYWVIQKKIIDQLVFNGDSVLILERYEEIEPITKYFQAQGYYIPQNDIGLARRLELLHKCEKKEKLLIASINQVNNILKSNHTYPVNLLLESLNLTDAFYCSQGSTFFNRNVSVGEIKVSEDLTLLGDDEENEVSISPNLKINRVLQKDSNFLLKLLKPKITSLRCLMHFNHSDNQLFLLDPRIDDSNENLKEWNVSRQYVYGFERKEDFDADVIMAESFIQGPRRLEMPFTESESLEIIRKVFIKDKPWTNEQKPYLSEIMKSEKDWVVSLPTGGGKSVLFQGPALYKSSFTNRLTVVITPLKALMEDQVNSLWEKGFFGCVDFLNAERGSDTELIYRSLSGGELSLLFVTPERFRSRGFLNALDSRIQSDGGLEYIVFDEAHCVSQWGHDFRPDYFNCAKMMFRIKKTSSYNTPILLFSATVTKKIYNDFNTIFS